MKNRVCHVLPVYTTIVSKHLIRRCRETVGLRIAVKIKGWGWGEGVWGEGGCGGGVEGLEVYK